MYTHEWSDVQHCPIGLDGGQLRSGGTGDRPHPHDKWQKSPSRATRVPFSPRHAEPPASPPCAAGGGSDGRRATGARPAHRTRPGARRPRAARGHPGAAPHGPPPPADVRNIPYAPLMSPVARLAGSVVSPAATAVDGGATLRRCMCTGTPRLAIASPDTTPRPGPPSRPVARWCAPTTRSPRRATPSGWFAGPFRAPAGTVGIMNRERDHQRGNGRSRNRDSGRRRNATVRQVSARPGAPQAGNRVAVDGDDRVRCST